MARILTIILTFFTLSLTSQKLEMAQVLVQQKEIIGTLSGHQEWSSGVRIENRSSVANRELSKDYLFHLLEKAGFKAEEQVYEMPNLNPLIDLLFNPFQGSNVYSILPATKANADYVRTRNITFIQFTLLIRWAGTEIMIKQLS